LRRFRAGSANDTPARLNPIAGKKFHAIQSAFNRSPGMALLPPLRFGTACGGPNRKKFASAVYWRWQRKNKQEDSIN
jgi:hypothetical protein